MNVCALTLSLHCNGPKNLARFGPSVGASVPLLCFPRQVELEEGSFPSYGDAEVVGGNRTPFQLGV